MKPIVQNFKKEESLQAAIATVEVMRSTFPKKKKEGRAKNFYTKAELQEIKPSDVLVRGEQEEEQEEQEEQEQGMGRVPEYDDLEME